MKYLSWLLPSKEKRLFVLVLAASVRKVFFSFWLGDLRRFNFPTGGPIMKWGCVSVRITSWIYSSVPPLNAPQPEPWLGWPWQCSSFCSEARARCRAQWWAKRRNAAFLHMCCSLWLTETGLREHLSCFPRRLCTQGHNLCLFLQMALQRMPASENICLCLSLFVVRCKFDHATDVL